MTNVLKMMIFSGISWAASVSAAAQTYDRLHADGHWTLYRVNGVALSIDGSPTGQLDNICMAESDTADAVLKIAMLPRRFSDRQAEKPVNAWIQIWSERWNFRARKAPVTLSVQLSSYGARKASYQGKSIAFNATGFEPFGIFMMFAGSGRPSMSSIQNGR